MDSYLDALKRRREEILDRMERALAKSGRAASDAELMAVSKTVDVDAVDAALRAGYRLFGENRPQELARKVDALAVRDDLPPYRFDMIGNLQTNKINSVLGRDGLIHSVSSEKLACAVSERASRAMGEGALAGPQKVLLEVNVSGEESKSGFAPDELRARADEIASLPGIEVEGLMTMAPQGDPARARSTFSGLRELADELASQVPGLALHELSMGMSEDFELALEEGSTLVRLGRVVFDPQFSLEER